MILGIDVSNNNGEVDWPAVARAGVRVAYLKVSEGVTYQDSTWMTHYVQARQEGIKVGAYHFLRAQDAGSEQASWFLSLISQVHPWDLPPAIDLEEQSTDGQPAGIVLAVATAFMQLVSAAVQAPIVIYTDPSFWRWLGDPQDYHQHPLWIAHYTDAPQPDVPGGWPSWSLWQHSDAGDIPGISGRVDLNRVQDRFVHPEPAV